MGFNMAILPQGQSLAAFYGDDPSSRYMPEEYAQRLAAAKAVTINHVTPVLQQKLTWPEYQRTILLTGVRGEVYVQDPNQKPILEPVDPGTVIVGYELHRSLKLQVGQAVKLMGREFRITSLRPGRGSRDDIALVINLSDAQEILDKKGLINSILALECECSTERLAAVRGEISSILPDTQVIEFAALADTRAQARNRAAEAARLAVEHEKQNLLKLRGERMALARVLIPLVLACSGLWIMFLTFANVRERATEIGILRAVGLRCGQILCIFLGKALLMGVCGGCIGYLAGGLLAVFWRDSSAGSAISEPFIQFHWLLMALVGAPVLAALAASPPALLAARQDPADILREE
jgi:putative ABC transport system permease protein